MVQYNVQGANAGSSAEEVWLSTVQRDTGVTLHQAPTPISAPAPALPADLRTEPGAEPDQSCHSTSSASNVSVGSSRQVTEPGTSVMQTEEIQCRSNMVQYNVRGANAGFSAEEVWLSTMQRDANSKDDT